MKTTNYNIRLDPKVKIQAEETFAAFGLKLSEAINVFLHMSINQHGFPFELREPRLKAEVLQAMEETEQIIKEYSDGTRKPKPYKNAHDFLQEILDEGDEEDV
ncbi:MAG: type II toxin-antitoxin system RelB/DinJ family antitoxin [Oscillospiraceae bacterium]|nr:type II toxin-antitoxin system RelB/DinJ family antitoxin [Oscillospiraceae bacterium]